MYKDKNKQREANRAAQARFKAKGITEEQTDRVLLRNKDKGITDKVLPASVVVPLDSLALNLHHC